MSYITLPSALYVELPSIHSESEPSLSPIVPTIWKCRRQFIATVVITLGILGTGSVFGWAAVAIPDLIKENVITFDEATMASLFMIGALISGPITGYLMLKFGRKKTLWVSGVVFLIGWAFIPLARFIPHDGDGAAAVMYIGRFVTGMAGAACLQIGTVYVSEICSCDEYRSTMGAFVPLMLVIGLYYGYSAGALLSWFWLTIACSAIPCVFIICLIWIPESPRYILSVAINEETLEEAKTAYLWYVAGFERDEQERLFIRMKLGVELFAHAQTKPIKQSGETNVKEQTKTKFTSPPVIHPLVVSVILVFFQQSSGVNFLTTYALDIFKSSGGLISPEVATNLVGLFLVIFLVVALVVVDKMRRKPLLIGSAITMATLMYALGIFFYLKKHDSPATQYLTWIPVLSGTVFVAAYSIGMGSVTWTVSSEINHPDFREISGTLTSTTYWLTGFIINITAPALRNSIGYDSCCWIYGTLGVVGAIFIALCVLETKGKTTADILAHYQGTLYVEDGRGDAQSLGSIRAREIALHQHRTSNDTGDGSEQDLHILFDEDIGTTA